MRTGRLLLVGCVVVGTVAATARDAGTAPSVHGAFEALLSAYTAQDGSVQYARWRASPKDVASLDAYLDAQKKCPPVRCPTLFPGRDDQLGYWLNLYNALVVRRVIERWPVLSVQQVPGFFTDPAIELDGKRLSLDQIENEIVRRTFRDARIHFALNCGARSCPVLEPRAFTGAKLAQQLDQASRRFINDPREVEVRPAEKAVQLSKLFEWYGEDFAAYAKANGAQPDVLGMLQLYAEPKLAAQLERARADRYRLVFREYDWTLNRAKEPGPQATVGVGRPAPDAAWPLIDGGTFRPADAAGRVVIVDFWASWCLPCRASFPALDKLHRAHAARGLTVVGVAQEPNSEAVAAFLRSTGVGFRIAVDADATSQAPPWSVTSMPTEVLIDRKGVVRFRHEGVDPATLDQVGAEVLQLLQER